MKIVKIPSLYFPQRCLLSLFGLGQHSCPACNGGYGRDASGGNCSKIRRRMNGND